MKVFESKVQAPEGGFQTLSEKLIYQAKVTPGKTVYIQLDENGEELININYASLVSNSISVSKQLLEHHNKGDRCLIAIPGGVEFMIAFLGCVFAGIIAVPVIMPKKNKENTRFWSIVTDSEPTSILTTKGYEDLLMNQLRSSTHENNIKTILNVKVRKTDDYLCDVTNITSDDIAFLQYTSGSIGSPKGIMVSHSNLLHNSEIIKQSFNHTPDLVGVLWLPPYHDMGLIGSMIQPLYVGGSCVIIQPVNFIKNPAMWFEAISKYKGTTVGCPNFALDYCIEKITDPDVNKMDLSSLKVMFCGSEPIRKTTLQNFSEKFSCLNFKPEMFLPCYGLAEATLMVSGISQTEEPLFYSLDNDSAEIFGKDVNLPDEGNKISYTSCGKAWNNTDIIVADPDTHLELSENQTGEIWVKNSSVCSGYWNKPVETKETFKAFTARDKKGPYLKTGDLGFIKENNVYITGRIKELMIINGVNIYPGDIENIVDSSHIALQSNSCAVFSVDRENKEKLVIVQEIKRSYINNYNKDEVIGSIINAVSDIFEVSIHSIVIISPMSLPKTSSGKIKRLACRELYLDDRLKTVTSWKEADNFTGSDHIIPEKNTLSADELVLWIKNWLGNKLNIDPGQIDPDQSILSFGLDSIGAVELESDINEKFNLDLFVGDFMENNSINYLVKNGLKSNK